MKRLRSRSPYRDDPSSRKPRHRSMSPTRPYRSREHKDKVEPTTLPLGAQKMSRHDLENVRPMFALYMDIQKHLILEDLPENEVKGRWKSFVRKWNYGELAEGWYDPKTLEKALASSREGALRSKPLMERSSPRDKTMPYINDEDDDDYGPAPPDQQRSLKTYSDSIRDRAGPSIPGFQDLQVARELAAEDLQRSRDCGKTLISDERRLDRKTQADGLDELAPKAAAGTRERQLEKRREKAESNRAFAASKDAGDVDLRDADVMGDQDSLSDLKRMQAANERKKNEREIRREENLRARRAETEERVKAVRDREKKTMDMLKEIARARFGGSE